MAILNPNPGCPRMFSEGISQSSKMRLQVEDPLIPSLSSFLPSERPFTGLGTKKAEMPLCFKDLSVVAKTTVASDS